MGDLDTSVVFSHSAVQILPSSSPCVGEKRSHSSICITDSEQKNLVVPASFRSIYNKTVSEAKMYHYFVDYRALLPQYRNGSGFTNEEDSNRFKGAAKYFTNFRSRSTSEKRVFPSLEECNSSLMGVALGICWDLEDPSTLWIPHSNNTAAICIPNNTGGLGSVDVCTAESVSGSEDAVQHQSAFPLDNVFDEALDTFGSGVSIDLLTRIAEDLEDKVDAPQDLLLRRISDLEGRLILFSLSVISISRGLL